MLKIIWVILSLVLIGLIFLRTPQNQGLASFSTKSNILGSPSSAEQFLNNLTIILMNLFDLQTNPDLKSSSLLLTNQNAEIFSLLIGRINFNQQTSN